VVATLALGVGANAAMLSVLDAIFGAPPGVEDPAELRRLYRSASDDGNDTGWVPYIDYPSFLGIREAQGPGSVAAWIPSVEHAWTREDAERPVQVAWVSHDFFAVLGVSAARGRLFAEDESGIDVPAPVAVASHAFWTTALSADPGVVGRAVTLNDTLTYTIVGVAGEGFSGLDLGVTDLFLPLNAYGGAVGRIPWHGGLLAPLRLVARLRDGGTEEALAERATAGYRRQPPPAPPLSPRIDSTVVLRAAPMSEARGPARRDASVPISTRAAGVAVLVLLIACANVATLQLVRASDRRREIAVRLALGVSRGRLFSQLLIESLPLALAAGGSAWVLGTWGGDVLRRSILPEVPWAGSPLDYRSLAPVMALAVAAAFFAGLAPGVQALRVVPDGVFRSGASGARSPRSRTRSALLATQVALSVVLLVGAGLFARSLRRLDALPLGYDVDRLVFASIASGHFRQDEAGGSAAVAAVAAAVAGLDGVTGVARSNNVPMDASTGVPVYLSRDSESAATRAGGSYAVTPEFFSVAGMRIVDGRTFVPGDERVAIVNETMAALLWPGERPLGQCVHLFLARSPCQEVVGVASDARSRELLEEPTAQYFLPLDVARDAEAIVVRVSGDWRPVASVLRAELERTFDPRHVTVERMSDRLAPQLRPWRLGAQIFSAFGLLALLVTVVGVYSVMAYAVSQRTRELGVRVALGARRADILRLVVSDGLAVTTVGVAIGVGAALALGRLVESLLYGVTPRDPVAMTAAALGLLVAGVVASLAPGWRAAKVDPVVALSAE
jgi:predicted permease